MAVLSQTVLAATTTFVRRQTSLSAVVLNALGMMIPAVTKGQVGSAMVNSVVVMVVVLMMAIAVLTELIVLIMVTVAEVIVVMLAMTAGRGSEAAIHS